MLQKAFQFFVAISVVILTSAAVLLILSGVLSAFRSVRTNGITVVAGGISASVVKLIAALTLIVLIALIAAALRALRPKLR